MEMPVDFVARQGNTRKCTIRTESATAHRQAKRSIAVGIPTISRPASLISAIDNRRLPFGIQKTLDFEKGDRRNSLNNSGKKFYAVQINANPTGRWHEQGTIIDFFVYDPTIVETIDHVIRQIPEKCVNEFPSFSILETQSPYGESSSVMRDCASTLKNSMNFP